MRPTQRQIDILAELAKDRNPPPSYEELAIAVGLRSTGALYYQIKLMVARGLVTYTPHKARSLGLTSWGRQIATQRT